MLFRGWYQMISCPDCDLPPIEREGDVQQRAPGCALSMFLAARWLWLYLMAEAF